MKSNILENESLEDLQCGGLFLIQKKDGFRFGTDAILLSDFAKNISSKKTLDLCTGTGIVPMLLSAKTKTLEIYGLEIQEDIADMAKRSAVHNRLENRVKIEHGDLKNALSYYPASSFGLITCNPPYMKAGSAVLNESDNKIISRHEVMCTLEDVIRVSSKLLKQGGHLAMVHRPNRLVDVLSLMRKYFIEPKVLRFVHATKDKPPILFLVDGMMRAKGDIKILPPLCLYETDGKETEELKRIYERN